MISQHAREALRFLIHKGLTAPEAAGIVGNLMQESYPELRTGDSASGLGIAQWMGDRRAALIAFAHHHGKKPTDFGLQLDYLWQELHQPAYRSALRGVRTATSAAEAARAFAEHYEKPASSDYRPRVRYAKELEASYRSGHGADPHPLSMYGNPFRKVDALQAERIDQGVDYFGRGSVYALGKGKVVNISHNWYKGLPFIAIRLTEGPAKGKIYYIAEELTADVKVGQEVGPNTVIGTMYGGIEIGWANAQGTDAEAKSQGGYREGQLTALGMNMSALLHARGAPAGTTNGRSTIGNAHGYPHWGQVMAGQTAPGGTTQHESVLQQALRILGGGANAKKTITSASPKNLWRAFSLYLNSIGIGHDPQAAMFAHQASHNHWDIAEFEQALYQQPWFKGHFPGIFNPDGSFKLSPEAYNTYYHRFQGLALNVGEPFDRHRFGFLLNRYKDPSVAYDNFRTRLQAIDSVNHNQGLLNQLVDTAKSRGIIPKNKDVSRTDLYKFVMRQGNPEWTALWEEANLRAQALHAGLQIGTDVTRREIMHLMGRHPEFRQAIEAGQVPNLGKNFADLANQVRSMMPLSRLTGLGISRQDLFVLEFGGKTKQGRTQDEIAQHAQRIVDTYSASLQPKAHPEMAAGTQGTSEPAVAGLSGGQRTL